MARGPFAIALLCLPLQGLSVVEHLHQHDLCLKFPDTLLAGCVVRQSQALIVTASLSPVVSPDPPATPRVLILAPALECPNSWHLGASLNTFPLIQGRP